ncbi:MAG: SPFH domain-containing protein [Caldilineaceae bacterium]
MLETNIDNLLAFAAQIVWLLFAIYAILVFIRTLRKHGVLIALVRLFSFPVLLPLLGAFAVSLLSLAIVFVEPQQVGVVISVPSAGGIRPQPLRAGLHLIFPLLEHEIRYPIYWQTYTMSSKVDEGEKLGDDSIRARTRDGQEVHLDVSVIFRIDQGKWSRFILIGKIDILRILFALSSEAKYVPRYHNLRWKKSTAQPARTWRQHSKSY